MKKFLATLLALTMALALVACGGNNSAGTSGNDAGGANTSGDTAGNASGDASGAAGGTFTIGVIGPLTGGAAIYGTNVANAALFFSYKRSVQECFHTEAKNFPLRMFPGISDRGEDASPFYRKKVWMKDSAPAQLH